jgi:two-component system sensor histidine kinase FlrB
MDNIMEALLQEVQPLLDAIAVSIILVNQHGIVVHSNVAANKLLNSPLGLDWAKICQEYPNLQFKTTPWQEMQLITIEWLPGSSNINLLGKMVASLAHQIKTPLATAMLYAQLLLDKNLPIAKAENYAIKINERLRNLTQIIDSLMILIKGITPLPTKVPVQNIKDDLVQYVKDKKLYVDFDCLIFDTVVGSAWVNCDVKTLVSGVGNLINNSIEATTSLAKILILFSSQDGWLHIMVSDKGPGMSEHYKNNLFEPFVSTKATGTGLGLSILQIIVKSYRGSVLIESDHNGTKVIIKLPLVNDKAGE